jgi:hypothetical protein
MSFRDCFIGLRRKMRILFFIIGFLSCFSICKNGWTAAEEEEISSFKIYHLESLRTRSSIYAAVESIAEARITYNEGLISFFEDKAIPLKEKTSFLTEKYRKTLPLEKAISDCHHDIEPWKAIRDTIPEVKQFNTIRALAGELFTAKYRLKERHAPLDREINEGIYFSECLNLLGKVFDFPFSIKTDVSNTMLKPTYFEHLSRWIEEDILKIDTAARRVLQNYPDMGLSRKLESLNQILQKHKHDLRVSISNYTSSSEKIRRMSFKHFVALRSLPANDEEEMRRANQPIVDFFQTIAKIKGLGDLYLGILEDLIKLVTIDRAVIRAGSFLTHELLEALVEEATSSLTEMSLLSETEELVAGPETEVELAPLPLSATDAEEEASFPSTSEDWEELNEMFASQKKSLAPGSLEVPALVLSRFTSEEIEAIKGAVKTFVSSRSVKYDEAQELFNMLKMDPPALHGHNNLCVRIPHKEGDRFTIRFYDNPHGSKEGHAAFWRKALSSGFKESGWLS